MKANFILLFTALALFVNYKLSSNDIFPIKLKDGEYKVFQTHEEPNFWRHEVYMVAKPNEEDLTFDNVVVAAMSLRRAIKTANIMNGHAENGVFYGVRHFDSVEQLKPTE